MIKLDHITQTYKTPEGREFKALDDVSIEIRPGEIFGIIGRSGAGKSTLVRCINLLNRPSEGTVTVDGKNLTELSEDELRESRRSIGMIFQHFNLLSSRTVYDNVALPLELVGTPKNVIREKVEPLLKLVGKNNTKANDEPAKALIAELEKAAAAGCEKSAEILKSKQYIAKKSVWIFGGDGWAYDIGFGGLDHVLASGEDVNVMVFDTEMYSNTGGQASKASNIGEVCQFAAAGKEISKKSLSEIAMTYGYIYVAQIALGANPAQAVKAIAEAEAYPGPSLIIGYAPCELHGVKGGMTNCQNEMKKAVEAGYWNLFTFNPANKAQGKNPFTLTSKAVDNEKYQALLANETRYSRLTRAFPDRAKELFARNQEVANDRYEHLTRLVDLYK